MSCAVESDMVSTSSELELKGHDAKHMATLLEPVTCQVSQHTP